MTGPYAQCLCRTTDGHRWTQMNADKEFQFLLPETVTLGSGVAIETFLSHPPPCAEDPGINFICMNSPKTLDHPDKPGDDWVPRMFPCASVLLTFRMFKDFCLCHAAAVVTCWTITVFMHATSCGHREERSDVAIS